MHITILVIVRDRKDLKMGPEANLDPSALATDGWARLLNDTLLLATTTIIIIAAIDIDISTTIIIIIIATV